MERKQLRILLPLDGSWLAEAALSWANTIAGPTAAHLVLFRVELPLRAAVFMAPVMAQTPGVEKAEGSLAREYMEGVAIRLKEDGLSAEVEIIHEDSLE